MKLKKTKAYRISKPKEMVEFFELFARLVHYVANLKKKTGPGIRFLQPNGIDLVRAVGHFANMMQREGEADKVKREDEEDDVEDDEEDEEEDDVEDEDDSRAKRAKRAKRGGRGQRANRANSNKAASHKA